MDNTVSELTNNGVFVLSGMKVPQESK